jgi:hypothetical protein
MSSNVWMGSVILHKQNSFILIFFRQSFPGSQPVSMDRRNYKNIFQSPYMVSWKADGTR